jgi:hypothetical protein
MMPSVGAASPLVTAPRLGAGLSLIPAGSGGNPRVPGQLARRTAKVRR